MESFDRIDLWNLFGSDTQSHDVGTSSDNSDVMGGEFTTETLPYYIYDHQPFPSEPEAKVFDKHLWIQFLAVAGTAFAFVFLAYYFLACLLSKHSQRYRTLVVMSDNRSGNPGTETGTPNEFV